MIKKAICPNCGAEGTVGRYCEFCGTKIVEVQKHKENASTAKKVILDFKISKEEAIENLKKKLAYYFDELHALEEMLYETDVLDNDIVEVDCLGRKI